MTRRALRLVLVIAATATLAACGLKGDLYLPEAETDPPPAQPAPNDDEAVGEEIEEEQQDGSSRTPSP